MLFDVYQLGEDWRHPDPIAILKRGATLCDVRMVRRFPASASDDLDARFYAPATQDEILRRLIHAKVQAIGWETVMLVGTVVVAERSTVKSKTNSFKVGYLCKPPGAAVTIKPGKIPQTKKVVPGASTPSGFDPEDDDFCDLPEGSKLPTTYRPLDPSITM